MPTPEEILAGLEAIAREAWPLAVVWHVIAVAGLLAVGRGWRPSRRLVGVSLALPLASVAALAWTHRNPFNGALFTAGAITLAVLGARLPRAPVAGAPGGARALGAAMVVFGLVYPHFIEADTWLTWLYAAPTGLVPCPTLSLVIGVALLANGLGARALCLVLAGLGLFYGVFGVARLGVMLDVGLLIGAVGLLIRSVGLPPAERGATTASAREAMP